ncbi:mevalonate kinase [Acrasis kona]|uniref:Mevalonate kinase n=1 Tax=Acrasis kona TaxID=1008807 RepID=A0AAW2YVP2_9EUKA
MEVALSKKRTIKVSAPGKLILFGEHAVVYGKTALAACLTDLRTTMSIERQKGDSLHISASIIGVSHISFSISDILSCLSNTEFLKETRPLDDTTVPVVDAQVISLIEQHVKERIDKLNVEMSSLSEAPSPMTPMTNMAKFAYPTAEKLIVEDSRLVSLVAIIYIYLYLNKQDEKFPSFKFSMSSNLPIGAGLGSSSSFSVCLASCLLYQRNIDVEKNLDMVNKWSFLAEQLIHGTPSGIDNAVGTYGGVVAFSMGKIQRQISKIPNLRILIVNTKVSRNTRVIVGKVRTKHDADPINMKEKFNRIEEIAATCIQHFEDQEPNSQSILSKLIQDNHILLNEIGAGHEKLDQVVLIASSLGYSAKLTGAGGGGCAYVLLQDQDEDRENVLKSQLEKTGFECYVSGIGGKGIRRELNF